MSPSATQRPPRRVLHLDVDAFLASVEQALHPELRGLPLVVGGSPSSRNLVMSCSYEARAHGVRPGLLLSEARRLCPQAVFRLGDSQAANRLREQVARILLRFTPRVEIASIDDFFVDLAGTRRAWGAPLELAGLARAAILAELGLPVTIGIASNKTLARVAGKLAKPGGVVELWPGGELSLLARLPLGALPGAGGAIGRMLERFAIRTVGELALVPRELLFASFGTPGLALHARAHGLDDDPVEPTWSWHEGAWVERPPRSIRRECTFEPEEGRRALVEAMLSYLVERAAHRLRRQRVHGARVGCRSLSVRLVHVETRARVTQEEARQGAAQERRRRLERTSDSTDILWRVARELLDELPRRRALVKRVGLTLHELEPLAGWQAQLFDEPDARGREARGARGSRDDRQRRLDEALDRVRERHGFGSVLRGASAELLGHLPAGADGFQLRTPSLNQ